MKKTRQGYDVPYSGYDSEAAFVKENDMNEMTLRESPEMALLADGENAAYNRRYNPQPSQPAPQADAAYSAFLASKCAVGALDCEVLGW